MSDDTVIRTRSRTITDVDIALFAGFSGDYESIHVDDVYAAASPFGGRILHGNALLSIGCGLVVQTGIFSGHLGMLGMEVRFHHAVRPGDTVHAEMEETGCRLDSTGEREVVTYAFSIVNESDVRVLTGNWIQLRPANPNN